MSTDVRGAPAVPDLLTLDVLPCDAFRSLDELDEQLLTVLQRRAELAREEQRDRRENSLPAWSLTQENAMIRRYTDRLGRSGAEIAVAILALSRQRIGD
jgi:chorismate mutase